ncbi:hypothetical protein NOCA2480001 [metagenome]|uniref:Uncharacterized protein n=1 Tax=metagenome TaxID=256318 RepID=A0A2P2C7E4_9ZZZZ
MGVAVNSHMSTHASALASSSRP